MWKYKHIIAKFLVLMSFCFGLSQTVIAKKLVVGAKTFSEQIVLAEIAAELLRKEGYDVKIKGNIQTALLRKALETGNVDLYFEYTGTAYITFYKQSDPETYSDPQKIYKWVKESDKEKGLIWLDLFSFNNTNSFIMRKDMQEEKKIFSFSDLSTYLHKKSNDPLKIAISAEFYARADGYKRLAKAYDFPRNNKLIKMDFGLIYTALKNKDVDIGLGYSTDGRIGAWGFVNLKDDKNFFPNYQPAAVVREEILDKHPEIQKALLPMAQYINAKNIRQMNAAIDLDNKDPKAVAHQWIQQTLGE